MTRKWGDIVSIIFNTENQPSAVPHILYECEAGIVQSDTMSVTEFENDWILLAKKAMPMLPVTGGVGGVGGF